MEILALLAKTESGNKLFAVVMNRYSNLAKAISAAITTATEVATIVVDHWILNLGVQPTILKENGPQFT